MPDLFHNGRLKGLGTVPQRSHLPRPVSGGPNNEQRRRDVTQATPCQAMELWKNFLYAMLEV